MMKKGCSCRPAMRRKNSTKFAHSLSPHIDRRVLAPPPAPAGLNKMLSLHDRDPIVVTASVLPQTPSPSKPERISKRRSRPSSIRSRRGALGLLKNLALPVLFCAVRLRVLLQDRICCWMERPTPEPSDKNGGPLESKGVDGQLIGHESSLSHHSRPDRRRSRAPAIG
jgi:hypothetical protein